MSENSLFTVLNNILENQSKDMQNNEIFGLASLMMLLEIVDIFRERNIAKQITSPAPDSSNSNDLNLNGLLNQLQSAAGNNNDNNLNNTNIQQLLPLLMKLLGNKNNISKLANLLNPGKQEQQVNEEPEINEDYEEDDEEENNKKKTHFKNKSLDWSKLNI